jgi:hypothetical protein
MKTVLMNIALVGGLAWMLTGCGDTSVGDRVGMSINPDDQTASFDIELSDGLEIAVSGEFPIADGAGSLSFVPATREQNAKIRVKVYLAALVGDELDNISAVDSLPNGSPLPVAVLAPLLSIPVIEEGSVTADALFSVTPELQLGAMVGIEAFNSNNVPNGISICQNFRNDEKVAFAAICLYGPSGTERGGIFVGGTFGDVLGGVIDSDDGEGNILLASTALTTVNMNDDSDEVNLNLSAMNISSMMWSEQRHDPRRRLRGRRGSRAMKNVRRILSIR